MHMGRGGNALLLGHPSVTQYGLQMDHIGLPAWPYDTGNFPPTALRVRITYHFGVLRLGRWPLTFGSTRSTPK